MGYGWKATAVLFCVLAYTPAQAFTIRLSYSLDPEGPVPPTPGPSELYIGSETPFRIVAYIEGYAGERFTWAQFEPLAWWDGWDWSTHGARTETAAIDWNDAYALWRERGINSVYWNWGIGSYFGTGLPFLMGGQPEPQNSSFLGDGPIFSIGARNIQRCIDFNAPSDADAVRESPCVMNFQFRLQGVHTAGLTVHVPEPGTLALLGFGLAGLGLSGRRKA